MPRIPAEGSAAVVAGGGGGIIGVDDDERAALGALCRGDSRGLELLFQRYQVQAIRAALIITGDRQTAEDVVADAFVKVYERAAQFDNRRPFAPWFYRIVINQALAVQRQWSRQRGYERKSTSSAARRGNHVPGPEEAVAARELRNDVQEMIAALPAAQRAVVTLRYYLDMDEPMIAQTLGCPRGTVKWRLFAARKRLRKELAEHAPVRLPMVHEHEGGEL